MLKSQLSPAIDKLINGEDIVFDDSIQSKIYPTWLVIDRGFNEKDKVDAIWWLLKLTAPQVSDAMMKNAQLACNHPNTIADMSAHFAAYQGMIPFVIFNDADNADSPFPNETTLQAHLNLDQLRACVQCGVFSIIKEAAPI